jgi:hypothetical protein
VGSTPQRPHPLELERVQSSRAEAGELRLRLSGRWIEPQAVVPEDDELLVVNVEGRRHRFPASREERSDNELTPGRWSASFKIPTWAEPREEGQAALWIGDCVIPVPPLQEFGESTSVRASERRLGRSEPTQSPPPPAAIPAEPGLPPPVAIQTEPGPPPPVAIRTEPGPPPPVAIRTEGGPLAATPPSSGEPRSGPLSELLLKDTVAALHAELEQRTADAVQIRAALANAQSELESRSGRHEQLEATLAQLRGELDRLRVAVKEQRGALRERSAEVAELREQVTSAEATAELRHAEAAALRGDLAAANVSREAAVSEAAGLRSELDRVGSELAVRREQVDTESGHLEEANKLLADARALAEELRAADSSS